MESFGVEWFGEIIVWLVYYIFEEFENGVREVEFVSMFNDIFGVEFVGYYELG